MELNNLITAKEAAQKLNISRQTLYKLIKDDKLKAVNIGKKYLIDPDDINEFLQKTKNI